MRFAIREAVYLLYDDQRQFDPAKPSGATTLANVPRRLFAALYSEADRLGLAFPYVSVVGYQEIFAPREKKAPSIDRVTALEQGQ